MSNVSLILPAHNEETAIYKYLHEISQVCENIQKYKFQACIVEDGSTDNTRNQVLKAQKELKLNIILSPESVRLGYSKAVLRGINLCLGDIIIFMDSDGQYDPREIILLLQNLSKGLVVVGYRNPRVDSFNRIIYSKLFGIVFRVLFGIKLRDPSRPFLACYKKDLVFLLDTKPKLSFGFWWEFQARICSEGIAVYEIPVTHRPRIDGKTQAYTARKLPKIIYTHLKGLILLKKELDDISRKK